MAMFKKKNDDVKEPTPFEVGRDGSTDDLFRVNKHAHDTGDYSAQRQLQAGAVKAFNEGYIENVQTILAHADKFKTYYYGDRKDTAAEILATLVKGSDYPAAVVTLALDKAPADVKQKVLDASLREAATEVKPETEVFIAALLKAGANPNAEFSDLKGFVLARAIEHKQPLQVIEMLHEKGASFDDALFLMQSRNWKPEYVSSLKAYREKVTGQPATEEGEVLKELRQLRAEIAELREEMTKRLPPPRAPKAEPKPSAPVEKRPYPKF